MVASPNNGLTEFAPIRDTSGDHTDSVRRFCGPGKIRPAFAAGRVRSGPPVWKTAKSSLR